MSEYPFRYKFYKRNGKIKMDQSEKDLLEEHKAALDDGNYYLEISKDHPKRSIDQNGYQWGPLYGAILEYVNRGLTVKLTLYDVHETMMEMLAPRKIVKLGDFEIERIIRTSEMNTVQHSEYCENVRRFAAQEWGLDIEEPIPWMKRMKKKMKPDPDRAG